MPPTRTPADRPTAGLQADELLSILACPECKAPLNLPDVGDAVCSQCGMQHRRLAFAWELMPRRERLSSEAWRAWLQLQANGAVSYAQAPDTNLGVGQRDDCRQFSRFAQLHGLVLDIGCGPQPWPAYFDHHEAGTRFVGVDPLVGEHPAGYTQLRALSEHLPFRDDSFDMVVFATTLDHFVAPATALAEAVRVMKPEGTLAAWIGHKSAGAPVAENSPDWYLSLEKPQDADDVFHMKRLGPFDALRLFEAAGLVLKKRADQRVDEWRTNHFFVLST